MQLNHHPFVVLPAWALAGLIVLGGAACTENTRAEPPRYAGGGDPVRGRASLRAYGCHGCHTISGIHGADGRVGPALDGMAERSYIGGVVTNTPDQLVAWIRNPRALSPRTAMPDLRVTEEDARDMAAFLYTNR